MLAFILLFFIYIYYYEQKRRVDSLLESTRSSKTAATYSPTRQGSTIGVGGLNFSVRDGKRWNPAAIATSIRVTH